MLLSTPPAVCRFLRQAGLKKSWKCQFPELFALNSEWNTGERHDGPRNVRQAIIQATLCAVSKVFCSELIPQTSAIARVPVKCITLQCQACWVSATLHFRSMEFVILRRSYELQNAKFQSCSRPPQMLLVASHPSKCLLPSWPNCKTHQTHKKNSICMPMYALSVPNATSV